MQNNPIFYETGTLSSTTYKNKLEINLNITPETIKYLVENEDKSPWHWSWQLYFRYDTKSTSYRNNKWDTKLKSFSTVKETINRIKRQCTKMEKISANHISYKGLVSKIHKKLIQFNSKDNNNKTTAKPLLKMGVVLPWMSSG